MSEEEVEAGTGGGGDGEAAEEVGKRVESTAAMGRRWAEEPIAEAGMQVESEMFVDNLVSAAQMRNRVWSRTMAQMRNRIFIP
ncbi:hypothetical protein OsI_23023 [Oryza sativa Indica Group]|uniref:Uncharacterized protein n=1 Tax=Oryza sativa subsp. indica TaxID=39946 RepID=B8B2F4_ORYSI|nr:hypothetical protein OsI_23023 [Oryza sativa Indica Group]